ncbi:MAG: protein phosphatase [Defluviitaleaceae bacterium]|nr:protein phosphatase [Defluviitaleaceae bacterium]
MPNIGEIAIQLARENEIRKILEIVEKSKDKEEAIEKIKALLESIK